MAKGHDAREEGDLLLAATVVLLRDHEDRLETLMLRRNSRLRFAGGMWVFPGGRVDPVDRCPGDDDPVAPFRRAAVREAEEEAGLIVAADQLVDFSHWTPPAGISRRFATWFFLARAPEGAVTIDGGEIHDHRWIEPAAAMHRRDQGEIELAPPTWVTLDRLAQHSNVEAALAHARANASAFYLTRIARTDAGPVALWEGDAGYADGQPAAKGARHRLQMGDQWHYERS